MLYSHLLDLMREARFSPEEMGKYIGISGMTVRRWCDKPQKSDLPLVYQSALRDVCYRLIAEGVIAADSHAAKNIFKFHETHQYDAAMKHLGLTVPLTSENSDGQWLEGLLQIGSQAELRAQVDLSDPRFSSFKSLGLEWASRISYLMTIVRSRKFNSIDKLVAYGALFYLLTPIDFIPDHIPFVGLLDDFGVLGMAVAYYSKVARP